MRRSSGTPGFTLVEILVVLALLGLTSTLAAASFGSLSWDAPAPTRERLLRLARRQALETVQAVSLPPDSTGDMVLFLPDGRAVGGGTSALTGRMRLAPETER